MALSKKVILAPDSIYAYIDRGSEKHQQSIAFFRYFSEQNYRVFVDTLSLNEVYNDIYRKMSQDLAKDFIRIINFSDINIISPEESETRAAIKALINYRTLELRFSQVLMAVTATRRGINQIVTFEPPPPLFGLQTFYLPI
jgi:predicted nucleic acid-binding protein